MANKWHKSHKGPAHSVLGHGYNGNVDGLEFVVYKQKQCYPEYLVYFERMPVDELAALRRFSSNSTAEEPEDSGQAAKAFISVGGFCSLHFPNSIHSDVLQRPHSQ